MNFCHLSSDSWLLFSVRRLRAAGAGYGFGQQCMNFFEHAAGFNALGKHLTVCALQTGAFDQIADFKIELIFQVFGDGLHFPYHNRLRR